MTMEQIADIIRMGIAEGQIVIKDRGETVDDAYVILSEDKTLITIDID